MSPGVDGFCGDLVDLVDSADFVRGEKDMLDKSEFCALEITGSETFSARFDRDPLFLGSILSPSGFVRVLLAIKWAINCASGSDFVLKYNENRQERLL